jgi:hypothetical protein
MSIFKRFAEKVEQIAVEGQESQSAQIARTYQQHVEEANQLLRDKQALARETRQSENSSRQPA